MISRALRDQLDGRVLTSGDVEYDEARGLFNGAIDIRPSMIAQCAHARDVRTALTFARDGGLPIAVRSGGHGVTGACLVEDGLVIDMRMLGAVTVDPVARTATVGGGALWTHVDRACQPHGLATTGGRASTTGVAGLTLGGGSGWLERAYGLTSDNLLSVDLVTAAGELVTASTTEHPDLFWALHGGGGNFGIATSFTFRLHPVERVTAVLLLWPADRGRQAAGRFRDVFAEAPDHAGGAMLFLTGPPRQFAPAELAGRHCFGALVTYLGPEDEARRLIAPLLELDPPGGLIAEMPYADLQSALDDPPGMRNHWSSDYLAALPDAALDAYRASAERMIVPSASQYQLVPWGGAVARGAGTSPMADREAAWVVHQVGMWEGAENDERGREWVRQTRDAMRPWTTGATYLNFIGDEGADRVLAGFGPANHARLSAIKAEYDPDNVFNRWHNVPPKQRPVPA
ncbi:FAD/FMN-containing dehydrogenase [Herbihabitans rhizosphaerae]|uniref:FAD/FMN-containing dehydrogenase n=1 Tax=Herbihabitans rhizosphaerae TaxID=1872711 RepID=A0A4Q7KQ02_9PSEU|nr:FAD-binding oxidoreductase [Herbihabitans rhizosphaerae]RZS38878.1 FAD/FMN-containing dehydrogenase [Herbihabitans rhizosphaerae]